MESLWNKEEIYGLLKPVNGRRKKVVIKLPSNKQQE
jgi:hypothetical protein